MCEALWPRPAVHHNLIMSSTFSVIRGADLRAVPWKNGGGATREIAASPAGAAFDAFDWRVSVADVSVAGAFSVFDGIDRVLTLIEGAEMVLVDSAGPRHVLSVWDSLEFGGELGISAELPHGPTRDFNLMVRRSRARGSVVVRRNADSLSVLRGSVVLFCAAGGFVVNDERLSVGDTLIVYAASALSISIKAIGEDAVLLDARIVAKEREDADAE